MAEEEIHNIAENKHLATAVWHSKQGSSEKRSNKDHFHVVTSNKWTQREYISWWSRIHPNSMPVNFKLWWVDKIKTMQCMWKDWKLQEYLHCLHTFSIKKILKNYKKTARCIMKLMINFPLPFFHKREKYSSTYIFGVGNCKKKKA